MSFALLAAAMVAGLAGVVASWERDIQKALITSRRLIDVSMSHIEL